MAKKHLSKQQKQEVDKEVKKQVKAELKKQEKQLEKKIEQKFHRKALSLSKRKAKALGSKFREHASTAIIAAFGFIIALAWRDLIVKVVNDAFKPEFLEAYPHIGLFLSAIIVTIVAVIGIAVVTKYFKEEEKKE